MSAAAVNDLVQKISQLSEEDRLLLERRLAEIDDAEWRSEVVKARRIAQERGINQDTIDEAVCDLHSR